MAPCFGTILRLVKTNGKTKLISIIDNLIPHEKRIGDKLFIKYFVKPIKGFIAQSSSVLNDLKSFNITDNVMLIPHPIYDNFGERENIRSAKEKLGLEVSKNYIMFFGFIRDYKGLDLLLKAMSDYRVRNLGISLIVAGEYYNNEEQYLNLIDELEIDEQIELRTHFISNEEVRFYFSAADLIVQPYKTATQSGISQMAYHFEKPMVVTNVGGLPEIVPHGKAGYVTEVNEMAIADAIVDFYANNRINEYSSFLAEKKKEYSWKNMMDSIIELSKSE